MTTTTKRPANELKGVSHIQAATEDKFCYDLETIAIFYLGTDKLDNEALALVGYTLVNNHFEGCIELALEVIVDQKKFDKNNPLKFRQVIKDTERFLY